MTNKFDEMRQAVEEAKITFQAADNVADAMARLLVGRLRKVKSGYILASLKKELNHFNARTEKWKD